MKKKILFVLLIAGLAAMVFSQDGERSNRQSRPARPALETVTVSGSLVVAFGRPALKSGEDTYFVGGLNRLIGFIDGLKEGAQATVEGRVMQGQREGSLKFIMPVKLVLSGKTYDMGPSELPGSRATPWSFPGQMGPQQGRQGFRGFAPQGPQMPPGPR